MIDVEINEVKDPWVVQFRFTYPHTGNCVGFSLPHREILDDPTRFFGAARECLTQLAVSLAETQNNLAQADMLDEERAIHRYMKEKSRGDFYPSTHRRISNACAELVHGIKAAPGGVVSVSLSEFEVTVGRSMGRINKLRMLDEFKYDFMSQPANVSDISPGTSLILAALQQAAELIEKWWLKFSKEYDSKPFLAKAALEPPKLSVKIDKTTGDVSLVSKDETTGKVQLSGDLSNTSVYQSPILSEDERKKIVEQLANRSASAVVLPNPREEYVSPFEGAKPGEIFAVFIADDADQVVKLDGMKLGKTLSEDNFVGGYYSNDDVQMFPKGGVSMARGTTRSQNSKNPRYWAHAAEDKLNGIVQQAKQNLPENDETRTLLCAISDLISDHIHNMGPEPTEAS